MKEWSEETQQWMESLGRFGPTTDGEYIKGYAYDYEEGGVFTIYWNARDLRQIAAACLEVAESLEGGRDGA